MRVSDSSVFLLNRDNLARTRELLAEAQLRAATGLRVNKPSDDPLATAMARRQIATEKRAESYKRAIMAGTTQLQSADASLADVSSVLARVRELTVQASNDTLTAEQRAAIAAEVEELRKQMIALANTETNGQHIFAGYLDANPPFNATGVYSGDSNRKELEVAPNVRLEVSLAGNEIFGAAGGGLDVMQMLNDLVGALQTNDVTTVRSMLGDLDQATSQISNARAQVGSRLAAIEVAGSAVESSAARAQEARADLVGIDSFSAYSDLARAEGALRSAVELASMLPLPGLVGR